MSIDLMARCWRLEMSADELVLMLALCDIADDNGENVYPSIDHICWKIGAARRTVQRRLQQLRDRGALVVVNSRRHGWHGTEYRIDLEVFEPKPAWREPDRVVDAMRSSWQRGARVAPLAGRESRSGDYVTSSAKLAPVSASGSSAILASLEGAKETASLDVPPANTSPESNANMAPHADVSSNANMAPVPIFDDRTGESVDNSPTRGATGDAKGRHSEQQGVPNQTARGATAVAHISLKEPFKIHQGGTRASARESIPANHQGRGHRSRGETALPRPDSEKPGTESLGEPESQHRASGPDSRATKRIRPGMVSEADWKLGCICADMIEGATRQALPVEPGGSRRPYAFAMLAEYLASRGRASWAFILPVVSWLVDNPEDPRLLDILDNLRRYPQGAYPATDKPGEPSGVEEAGRILMLNRYAGQDPKRFRASWGVLRKYGDKGVYRDLLAASPLSSDGATFPKKLSKVGG